jgi:hypothetical protein
MREFITQMPADATPAIAQLLGLVDGIMNKPTGTMPTNNARRTAHLRSPEEWIAKLINAKKIKICKNLIVRIDRLTFGETRNPFDL